MTGTATCAATAPSPTPASASASSAPSPTSPVSPTCATPSRFPGRRATRSIRSKRHAAVDADHCAVDVAGVVGGEEREHVGHLLGLAEPAGRNLRLHAFQHFLRHLVEDRGPDEARAHRNRANALAPQLAGPGLGHPNHGEL